MSEPHLDPTPVAGGGGGRRAGIVLAIVVVLVAVAVWKPWQDPSVSVPSPSPDAAIVAEPTPAATDRAEPSPTVDAPPRPTPDPRSTAPFTTPPEPHTVADWSAIRWRRLPPDDPVALVRDVVRFDGGYLALGPIFEPDGSAGPAWASRDGASWTPLPRGTWASLWPDQAIEAAAAVPGGVVALTVSAGAIACAAAATCEPGAASVAAWVSADGLTWAPQAGIGLELVAGAPPPLLASGPTGLVAVSGAGGRAVALSANGGAWRTIPDALPWGFAATGLAAAGNGYVAAGWLWSDGRRVAATASSAVGERWTARPLPVPTAGAAASGASVVDAVLATERRLLLVGRVDATGAGWDRQEAWWSGEDAEALTLLPDVGPLTAHGALTAPDRGGAGPAGGGEAGGALAADGRRIVALAAGGSGDGWSSSDVVSWRVLRTSGDRPAPAAVDAIVLLPGGILATGAGGAWIGEALVPWPTR
jgi:hypothetical protein